MEGFLEFSDGTFFLWRSVGEVGVRVGLDSNEKGEEFSFGDTLAIFVPSSSWS